MPAVDVSHSTVHYCVSGSGPGLVLLHGTGGNGQSCWGHLVGLFTDRRTVITPDYSGSGDTVDHGGPLTLDRLVDQVAAVIEDVGGESVDLAGLSLGAVVAAAVAAKHPELARRVVLLGGWIRHDDARQQLSFALWRRLLDTSPELVKRWALLTNLSPPYLRSLGHAKLTELIDGIDLAPGTDRQIELDMRVDLRDQVHLITAPTLVVGMSRDQTVPVEHSRELHKAISGSRYAEIDSGHAVVWERPAELIPLMRQFLFD
jgi:pimeloyl-ACP methyl ester carboxylesterase